MRNVKFGAAESGRAFSFSGPCSCLEQPPVIYLRSWQCKRYAPLNGVRLPQAMRHYTHFVAASTIIRWRGYFARWRMLVEW